MRVFLLFLAIYFEYMRIVLWDNVNVCLASNKSIILEILPTPQ